MKKIFAAVSLLSLIAAPSLEAKSYATLKYQRMLRKKQHKIETELSKLKKEAGSVPTPSQQREIENLQAELFALQQQQRYK